MFAFSHANTPYRRAGPRRVAVRGATMSIPFISPSDTFVKIGRIDRPNRLYRER